MSNFSPSLWHPDADSYETSKEGWALYSEQQSEDIQALRELYPELCEWGDIERMNAWGAFCFDENFTSWTEPFRDELFLVYLKLSEERKLPNCVSNREAIHEFLSNPET
jgi:hypothetical protein